MASTKPGKQETSTKPPGYDPFVWGCRLIELAETEASQGWRWGYDLLGLLQVPLSDDEIRQREAFAASWRLTLTDSESVGRLHDSVDGAAPIPRNQIHPALRRALGRAKVDG